jgi:hypothetical protein
MFSMNSCEAAVQEYSAGTRGASEGQGHGLCWLHPSANSLQVGNLMTLMGLARLQRYSHSPIAMATTL